MKKLCIYGCGGLGREILDIACRLDLWDSICFVDDHVQNKEVNKISVDSLENILSKNSPDSLEFVIAVGEPSARQAIYKKLIKHSLNCINFYSPDFEQSAFTTIKEGTIVHAGAIITCNTSIGAGCLISKQAVVGHDVEIGDFCVISPNASVNGGSKVGKGTYIGAGAIIRNGVVIGENSIIGMGAVVLKDVEENSVMVGNPAVFLRKNSEGKVFRAK